MSNTNEQDTKGQDTAASDTSGQSISSETNPNDKSTGTEEPSGRLEECPKCGQIYTSEVE